MKDRSQEPSVPLSLLFWTGVGIELLAAMAVFTGRAMAGVVVLASAGTIAIIAAVLVPRLDEGRLEATRRGVSLLWRRRITEQIGDALSEVGVSPGGGSLGEGQENRVEGGFPERASTSIELADINNDGEPELVVQHPIGAHSAELQVFGWSGSEIDASFSQLASETSNYITGFTVGDLDGDGQVEIANIEPDWTKKGATSAGGPFVEVLRRWDGTKFAEVARRELGQDPLR